MSNDGATDQRSADDKSWLLRGLTATFVSRATKVLANGLLLVLLTRYLFTPSEYGLFSVIIAIIGIAQLFADLGVGRSTSRYLNEFKEDDPGQLPHILKIGFVYRLLLISVVVVALVAGRDVIERLVGTPELGYLLVVGAVYLACISMKAFVSILFQGYSHVTLSAIVNVVDSLVRVTSVIGLTLLGFGVAGAVAGYAIGAAFGTLVGLWLLYTRYYRHHDTAPVRDADLKRRILEYSIPLTASRSANVIDKRVDIILVGALAGPVAAGLYTLAKQIATFLDVPARSIGFTVSPVFGEDKANGQLERAARLYEQSLRYVLLLYIPAAVGIVLVADPAIELVFGVEYGAAVPIVQLMSVFVVFQAINLVTTQGLDYLGRARDRAIAKGITSVANLGLNLLLIPMYGAVGAALATVVTFTIYVLANLYVVHQELPIDGIAVIRTIGAVAGVTACMGVGVHVVLPYASDLESLLAVIFFGGIVWVVLSIGTGLVELQRLLSMLQ